MKKIIFSVITFVVVVTCMAACSNTSSELPAPVTTKPVAEEPKTPELPELSEGFIETALQFIESYPDGQDIENEALEIILHSNGFRDTLYGYLNWYLPEKHSDLGADEVHAVDVWIHNYDLGGHVGCVSYNGQDAVYNYDHNPILLSAGVLGKKYPDNVKLAEARIAGFVLTQMCQDDVSCCIVTTEGEKKSYDFTFGNKSFKETAREILLDLLED